MRVVLYFAIVLPSQVLYSGYIVLSDMTYYLFLDESGDHGLVNIDPGFPVFVLCGVLISEDNYTKIDESIKLNKQKYWGDKKVILHSRDIRKCEKEFQILLDQDLKADFYKNLNSIITQSVYTIISASINKEAYIKTYGRLADDIYAISLSFVIERTIFCLDELNDLVDKRLRIIIEKRGRREDKMLAEHFQKLLTRGTGFVNAERIKNYKVDFHFRDKKDDINGLQ